MFNLKKIISAVLCALLCLAVCAGCSSGTETAESKSEASSVAADSSTVNAASENEASADDASTAEPVVPTHILTISGPTGIGMAKMMQENDAVDEAQRPYIFEITTSPSDIMTAIVSGSADIAACPINLASKICKKTEGGVQMLAINTLGVLSIVTNGVEITSFADLDGKEIVASGEGATPEFALKYLCEAYGISVDLSFVDDFSTAATMVASGECKIAMLAEPSVSSARMKNSELTVALSLTEVWKQAGVDGKIQPVELAQGCVIVRTEFAKEHPEAVKKFLSDYASSVSYVSATENLEDAASLCEAYGIVPKAAIAKMAIPNCNLVCFVGAKMKTVAEENLKVLFGYDPTSIGGTMPDEAFYYAAE